MDEVPEKKTGIHQFVDLGSGSRTVSQRERIEVLLAGAILVISIAMDGFGRGIDAGPRASAKSCIMPRCPRT